MRLDISAFPVEVDIFLREYDGPAWQVAPFKHRSGWIMVAQARMETSFALRRRTLVAAVSDHGETYLPAVAERLLALPTSLPRDAQCDPPAELEEAMDALYWDFLGAMDLENLRLLEEAEEATAEKIRRFEAECLTLERKLFLAARELRSRRRSDGVSEQERAEIDSRLARLNEMAGELAQGMRQRAAEMRSENEALAEAVFASLAEFCEMEHCYCARWRARSGPSRRSDIRLPLAREMGFEAGFSADPWLAGADRPTLEQIARMGVFGRERD